ncbi:MAG: aminotransferase class I/II-fold pyridoxal phosphate-dependent enzyme [Robiginitalea sp.]
MSYLYPMSGLPKKLQAKLQQRRDDGSLRSLYERHELIDFSSNDYLGLARREEQPAENLPAGSSGSRLISGNHPLYAKAENVVRKFHLAEAALIFNSGYDANLGLLSAILQRGDYIFYDQNVHASIRDGIRLGNAKAFKFAHNDQESLKQMVWQVLKGTPLQNGEVYVITESVFSMEGDGPDLGLLAAYCKLHNFRLIVDEAHSAGILGPEGRGEVAGKEWQDLVFARLVTFGKSLGCHGAAVLCSSGLREYLINFSRSLIYTTALPPQSLMAILKAYQWIQADTGAAARNALLENIRVFSKWVEELELSGYMIPAKAAIRCCEIGGNTRVKTLSAELRKSGFDIKPILSPTVQKGRECLRFSLHSFNSEPQIREVLTILAGLLKHK